MSRSPFFPTAEQLPSSLPIFPLENAVVLPLAELPLNIFEPRYLNMVQDALTTHHLIGMVQPDPKNQAKVTPVYRTGCAGRITSFTETADGRILISLTGVCRFDIAEELPGIRGYRIIKPIWNRFLSDLDDDPQSAAADRDEILKLLKRYFEIKDLSTDWKVLEQLPTLELVHTMSMLIPLEPVEKQAILEAESFADRNRIFCSSLRFSVQSSAGSRPH